MALVLATMNKWTAMNIRVLSPGKEDGFDQAPTPYAMPRIHHKQ